MKKQFIKCLLLFLSIGLFSQTIMAQKKKSSKGKTTAVRKKTTRTTKNKQKTSVTGAEATSDLAAAQAPVSDSLPIPKVPKSLRRDGAVDDDAIRDRTPLPYENLRADDAVYRHKIWREIDTREKLNLPFRYNAQEDNGDQRFIMILLQAIQDSTVTVFDASVDDRFTTPMTKSKVAELLAGAEIDVPIYDKDGNLTGNKKMRNEINFDSIYKFHLKEEVVFDKESSRLFFRILGIAPVKKVINSQGDVLGETEVFWVYYPDMRATFAKHEVYNGKNFGARMSWEELFESRMFYGRIVKSTIDNPYNQFISEYKGIKENPILQLLEGETIKEKIFNYEQDLWSY
jgi:gliding motility associated protien GldN